MRTKKLQWVYISKTTSLHLHHALLYISLPSLHDYNVKVPNFTFCRGRKHTTTTFLFFSWTLIFNAQKVTNISTFFSCFVKCRIPWLEIKYLAWLFVRFYFTICIYYYVCQYLLWQKKANIWRIKRYGISALKFEAARIHFLRDVFVTVVARVA